MSFTKEIKQEVSYNELKPCCGKAELSALIQLTSSLSISKQKFQLVIKSENPTTVKRIASLLKDLYPTSTELSTHQKTNLKKNNVYHLTVLDSAISLLEFLGLYSSNGLLNYPKFSIIAKNCCARAYLAGAFIAYGSCNAPTKTNYHLEIALNEEAHANFIVKLLERFDMEAKISKRRKKYIVYLKKADSISDFLRCIGAHESLMNFENMRINRDFKNSLIRLNNCEIANDIKSMEASKQQIAYMQTIIDEGMFDDLDEKLQEVITLRMQYPDCSLKELCDEYQKKYGQVLSRSGLNHRLNKIKSITKGVTNEKYS